MMWPLWARTAQLPPEGEWRVWLLMGGRGAGKTRAGAEWVRGLVERGRARRVALVGPTLHDVREVMIEGASGLKAVAGPGMRPAYNVSRRRVEWPNGAVGHVFSAEDPDSLRGPQFDAAWCDEIGAWARDEKTWETLMFALRVGQHPRVAATTTPRPRKLVRMLAQQALGSEAHSLIRLPRESGDPGPASNLAPNSGCSPEDNTSLDVIAGAPLSRGIRSTQTEPGAFRVIITRAATRENAKNLAPGFLPAMEAQYGGTRVGRQELDGELIADPEGALFTRAIIERGRMTAEQAGSGYERVVVGVDPPAGSGPDSAACGIVAAGLRDGVVHVLRDASAHGLRPMEWAVRAVALARVVGAGVIVAEANQGGEMVRQVLELAGAKASCRVALKHARASKFDRAQPLSGLYEAGLVRHVGVFRELEDEMCAFGADGDGAPGASPDRVDALVWAVMELREKRLPPGVIDLWAK